MLLTWGRGKGHGHDTDADIERPRHLSSLPPIRQIACGDSHTLALTTTYPLRKILPSDDWSEVSDAAKAFITRLLKLDPAQRPTAAEALEDPWITNEVEALPLGTKLGPCHHCRGDDD